MTPRISDLKVEQLLLGELPEAEAASVRAELEATGDARLTQLEASNAEILDDYPVATMAERIRRRAERDAPSAARAVPWTWLSLSVIAAVCVLWLVARTDDGPPSGSKTGDLVAQRDPIHAPDTVRLKGEPALLIHRRRAGKSERLLDGATAAQGDRLQVSYRAAEATHGVIVSIDGAGAVTLHHPRRAEDSTELTPGGVVSLDHSYRLDDAPRFERFVFVTSAEPVSVAGVMKAAQAVAATAAAGSKPLELAPGETQISVEIVKLPR